LNFEVIYPSGIILTEAPSIVETTHTQQRRAGASLPARWIPNCP